MSGRPLASTGRSVLCDDPEQQAAGRVRPEREGHAHVHSRLTLLYCRKQRSLVKQSLSD